MSDQANIQSIAALQLLRASLTKFADTAALVLDEVDTDVHRTLTWLNNECLRYWKNEVFQRQEQRVQAKLALSSRLSFERSLQGTPSSCVDERKALKKAELRLEHARKKLSAVRSWSQHLEKAQAEYRARVQGLSTAVSMDIPNARAALDRMTASLEAYVKLAPPETQLDDVPADPEQAMTSNVHRPVPDTAEEKSGSSQQPAEKNASNEPSQGKEST